MIGLAVLVLLGVAGAACLSRSLTVRLAAATVIVALCAAVAWDVAR